MISQRKEHEIQEFYVFHIGNVFFLFNKNYILFVNFFVFKMDMAFKRFQFIENMGENTAKHNMINLMIKLPTEPVLIQLLPIKKREKEEKLSHFLAFTMYQAHSKHLAFLILFKLHNNPTRQTRSLSLFYR